MRSILLTAVAFIALSAQNAFAVNLTFQFDVNSSGPSIYACNAGIRHAESARICYDRISGNSCTPSCAAGNAASCTNGATPQSCVCTGEENGGVQGTWRLDYLKATTADWVDNTGAATNVASTSIEAPNSANFATVFGSDGAAFGKQLTGMTINLGSEVYGAEYFVDVCYRGPQIDYTNIPGLNFGLKGKVTVTNLRATVSGAPNYQDVAKLNAKAEVRCFMQDSFDNCTADTIPGVSVGCGNTADGFYNYTANSGAYTPMYTSAQETTLLSTNSFSAGATKRTPRFCVVRYTFKESALTMRKWKLQQARACTYTEITEPN